MHACWHSFVWHAHYIDIWEASVKFVTANDVHVHDAVWFDRRKEWEDHVTEMWSNTSINDKDIACCNLFDVMQTWPFRSSYAERVIA